MRVMALSSLQQATTLVYTSLLEEKAMPRRTVRVQVRVKQTIKVTARRTVRPVVYGGYPQIISQGVPPQLTDGAACAGCGVEGVTLDEQGLCEECALTA
jgi:hypothetical protein